MDVDVHSENSSEEYTASDEWLSSESEVETLEMHISITPCKDNVEDDSFPAVHHIKDTEKNIC